MAQRSQAHQGQAPGAFFVDRSCIDCGTCYQFAPEVFEDAGEHSRVHAQPGDPRALLRASMALLACPTSSIGSEDKSAMGEAAKAFPDPVEEEVSFCGFTSDRSYGAWSWLVQRPEGHVLVDSPRAAQPLLKRIEELGGLSMMVLSHGDDVADHAVFRERFGCARIMHPGDGLQGLERYVEEETELAPGLRFIPTPGHTRGSACLLWRDKFLFSGDHLWWNPQREMLSASKTYNWYSWKTQLDSLEKLLGYDFQWVLPGHGSPKRFDSPAEASSELLRGIEYLKRL